MCIHRQHFRGKTPHPSSLLFFYSCVSETEADAHINVLQTAVVRFA